MKKFTLLCCAMCATLSLGAQDFTRLTAEDLNSATTSKRIAIRCTQNEGNNYNTFYNGTATRVTLPLTEAMVFEWEPTTQGQAGEYYIKKAFASESAYLQTTNISTFGDQTAETVAKFHAVKPVTTGFSGNEDKLNQNEPIFENEATGGEYYVRLCLSSSWFNFSVGTYNNGTGVWTVQNIIDLSDYYKVTINITKDEATTVQTAIVKAGEIIEIPAYEGYKSDYAGIEKTADDEQIINVSYQFVGLPYDLVTNETLSTAIVDGAVIALQCKDTNGGYDSYFNGNVAKSAALGASNLFYVEGVEGSESGEFYLKQLSSGKYVGGSTDANALVQLVDEQTEANVFTASIASPTGWTTKPDDVVAGTNTVRFTTGATFLNTNTNGATPKYFTGTGGFSVWYVYSYTPYGVLDVMLPDAESIAAMFKDDTPGFYSSTGAMNSAVMAAYGSAKELAEGTETITMEAALAALEALNTSMQTEDDSALGVVFNGIYTIKNHEGTGSRGYLCDVAHESNYVWSSGKTNNTYTIPELIDPYAQWAFVEVNGERLLFNVGSKKFISPTNSDSTVATNAWILSDTKAEPITLVISKDGVGTVGIRSIINDATHYMSISNNYDTPVAGYYNDVDGGVPFVFERVGDLAEDLRSEMQNKNPLTTGIEEVEAALDAPVEYYDLNGRRVLTPANGLFIKRQGSQVSKIIL